MSIEQIQLEMKDQLARTGLLPFLVEGSSQILELDGQLFAEIVLSDASKIDAANDVLRELLSTKSRKDKGYTLVIRAKWSIVNVDDPTPAYGESGGLRAAVLMRVTLESGTERRFVTVAVTKLAEMELERILGSKVNLKRVAEIVVSGALRRGGRSYWDPSTENYLEVASNSAPNISRLLKQTA